MGEEATADTPPAIEPETAAAEVANDFWSDDETPAADATESPDLDTSEPEGDDLDKPRAEVAEEPEEEPAPSEARRRFLAATKKEKELLGREQAVKQAEANLKAWSAAKAKFGEDPVAALTDLGLDPGEVLGRLSEKYLQSAGVELETDPLKQMQAKLDKLERERAEEREQAQRTREASERIEAAKRGITSAIEASSDKFPTIVAKGQVSAVFNLMERYFDKHGEPLSWEDAASRVERKLSSGNAERSKESPATSKERPKKPPTKTLSSRAQSSVATRKQDDLPEDPDERRREVSRHVGSFWG